MYEILAWYALKVVFVSTPGGDLSSEAVRCPRQHRLEWPVSDPRHRARVCRVLASAAKLCRQGSRCESGPICGVPGLSATRDWRNDGYDISIFEHCLFNFGIQHHLFIHSPS